MSPPANPLDDLRREIDRLDDQLLDALCERMNVVRRIALVKNDRGQGRLAMRPAREAAILRRLVGRAQSSLPTGTVVALWRELLAATTAMQTPFVVTVHVPDGRPEIWDLARDHFGSVTPLIRAESPGHALRNLGTGGAQLAVLPMPDERHLWWRALVHGGESMPAIVGRLPFCPLPARQNGTAVIVATMPLEPSGDDVTIFAVEAVRETSQARLVEALCQGDLPPRWLATVRANGEATALHLFEVDGFIGSREPRLSNSLMSLQPQILRVTALGGYPRPLQEIGRGAERPRAQSVTHR